MEQKIITAHSASELNSKLADLMKEGWKPMGSHHVVESHHQMRFAGMQHKDTIIEREYSVSVQREHTPSEGQKEVIERYVDDMKKIMETKTDDMADIKNLMLASIEFLRILNEKAKELAKL
jgi:hypothetical protein